MRRDVFADSRRRKKRKKRLKLLFFLILLILLSAGFVSLFYISKFRVSADNIKIEGNEVLDSGQIKAVISNIMEKKYFYLLPKNNIFIIPEEKIKDAILQENLRIKNTSFFKDLPNGFIVKIEERKPKALLCNKKEECAFIDDKGFIFETAPFFSGSVFIKFFDERKGDADDLIIGDNILRLDQYKNMLNFINLSLTKDIRMFKIILKPEGVYELYTNEGWYIILTERNSINIAFDNLKIAIENQIKNKQQELEYIDLRLENKVFYKYD